MLILTSNTKMVYIIFVEIFYFFDKIGKNEINGGIYNEKVPFITKEQAEEIAKNILLLSIYMTKKASEKTPEDFMTLSLGIKVLRSFSL